MTKTHKPQLDHPALRVQVKGDTLKVGDQVTQIERPENAVRWVKRGKKLVLQQRWTATARTMVGNYHHEEWRDVPVETE